MGAHGHLAYLKDCGLVDEEEEAGCGCEKCADGFLTPYLLEPLPVGIEHKQCSEMTGKMIYHHRIQLHIKFQPENGTSFELASSPTSMAARLLKPYKHWYFSLVRARCVSRSTGPSQRSGKNGARGISID